MPPQTIGRTAVDHFILALVYDSFFPDHIRILFVSMPIFRAWHDRSVHDARYHIEESTT